MELATYKKYWNEIDQSLRVIKDPDLAKKVMCDTYDFLTIWGLPDDAAPFLSFSVLEEGELMSVDESFGYQSLNSKFLFIFGTNGSGDPICIDANTEDEIVYLNHDNEMERIYMNKNISKFAFCVVRYDQFMKSTIDYSNDEPKRKPVSINEYDKLISDFNTIDNTCLAKNSFWSSELNELFIDLKINK